MKVEISHLNIPWDAQFKGKNFFFFFRLKLGVQTGSLLFKLDHFSQWGVGARGGVRENEYERSYSMENSL